MIEIGSLLDMKRSMKAALERKFIFSFQIRGEKRVAG